ncbi:Uma2 family endonuclease [Streptomyces sp. WAC05374]|nr:Uma2 family endonuclease [Streptomyces sp. WAC05374]TDF47439.1 Uma2 family endonuclease [Streptomyces sp. WAC05374]TDF57699.1 Uma2 family endonuclease [Streptomyces sp. WAC05374]TDF61804.1 Uma2 family endonuclease [Streptomyces sp. WAC05374]
MRALSGRLPCLDVGKAFDVFNAVAPEGWRVELIEGDIHVTPPPNGEHEEILAEVSHQVMPRLPDKRLRTYTGIGLNVPGASMTGHVEPDLAIAPRGSFAPEAYYHDPSRVLLVCEVTSRSTAANDPATKILGYARAGIPVHLLIDRQVEGGAIVVYSKPEGDTYTRQDKYTFSQMVPLPEPLGFEIDTSAF